MSQEALFRLRRCARGIFSLSGLLALGLLFANVGEARTWYPKCNAGLTDLCCWSGTAPVCLAGCPHGFNKVGDSKDADGALSTCTVGTHKLCCPSGVSASFVAPEEALCKPQTVERGEGILGLALPAE